MSILTKQFSNRTNDGKYRVVFRDTANLLVVIGAGQCGKTVRMESSASRIQFDSVVFRKFRAKRVDSDDQSTAISFKLILRWNTVQNFHDINSEKQR